MKHDLPAAMARTVPMARFELDDGVRASDVVAKPVPMPSEASRFALLELIARSAALIMCSRAV